MAAQALEAVERARSRTLLELLTEARIDVRQGVNTDAMRQRKSIYRFVIQRR